MAPRFHHVTLQKFSFRNPLINYLMNNLNGNLLKKLHKTCKWFFVRLPFTLLDSLGSFDRPNDMYNGFFTANKMNEVVAKGNIWVLNEIFIFKDTMPPSIASKIVRCDVRLLMLHIDLTLDELKVFTNSGKVTSIVLDNKIYHSDNSLVPPEDILPLVPKASKIMLNFFSFPKKTMLKLLKLNHFVKIEVLLLWRIDEWIDIDLLCQFLEKFLDQDMNPLLSIVYNDPGMNNAFGIAICEKIKRWKPTRRIPRNFPYVNKTRYPASLHS